MPLPEASARRLLSCLVVALSGIVATACGDGSEEVVTTSASATQSTTGPTEASEGACPPNASLEETAAEVRELQAEAQADYDDGGPMGTAPDRIVELSEGALIGSCENQVDIFCAIAEMACWVTHRDGEEVMSRTDVDSTRTIWLTVVDGVVAEAEVPWSGIT